MSQFARKAGKLRKAIIREKTTEQLATTETQQPDPRIVVVFVNPADPEEFRDAVEELYDTVDEFVEEEDVKLVERVTITDGIIVRFDRSRDAATFRRKLNGKFAKEE